MRYIITTAYGNRYVCDKDGYVLEYSNGLKKDSNDENRKTWQITGAWYYIGYGHTRTISLEKLAVVSNLKLLDKRPRYGLIDIDHGTCRWHGNKRIHGVRSITVKGG